LAEEKVFEIIVTSPALERYQQTEINPSKIHPRY
jgi:hypothetical protein